MWLDAPVLYADDGQHWRLKAEVSSIACGIHRYLDEFHPCQLHQLDNGAQADVIWYME